MKRDVRFGFVLTPEERAKLQTLAELEGLSEAAILRRLIRVAAKDLASMRIQRRRAHNARQPEPASITVEDANAT